MEISLTFGHLILPPALFGLFLCTASWLLYKPKEEYEVTKEPLSLGRLNGQSYQLVCLWEDAPESALQGQAYEITCLLASPLACLWEDAPESALQGQAYELAYPFASPWACLWEDAPESALQGQAYELAYPFASPWACLWEDAPESALQGQVCELAYLLASPLACLWEDAPKSALRGQFCEITCLLASPLACLWEDAPRSALRGQFCEITCPVEHHKQHPKQPSIDESQPWWKILGVKPQASSLQVEKAYKRLIWQWHPDRNKSQQATQMTAYINVAYQEYKLLQQSSAKQGKQLSTLIRQGINFIFWR